MTISEFRDYADSLGRFATTREKRESGPKSTASHRHGAYAITFELDAEGSPQLHRPLLFVCKGCSKVWRASEINRQYDPTDSILVQAIKGRLKLVAGTGDSTLIVDTGETELDGKRLVSARLLLNAAKSLRGKGSVEFGLTQDGLSIKVSTGAEVQLPNVDDKLPDWIRPGKTYLGSAPFKAGFWPEASKVFDATSGKVWPLSHVTLAGEDAGLSMTASDGYAYSSIFLDRPDLPSGYIGSVSSVFTGQLRGIEQGGDVHWTDRALVVEAGSFIAIGQLYQAAVPLHHDMFDVSPVSFVTIDKKVLTDMVRGVASNDEHNRVALATGRTGLVIHPYADPSTSMRVPAAIEGEPGSVGVDAGLLTRCLTAYPGKTVNLAWAPGLAPIRLTDKAWPWRMFLAPIVQ